MGGEAGDQLAELRDLPVSVDLPERLRHEVTAYIEGEAGWQVVEPDGPPAPVLAITTAVSGDRPCVLVTDGVCAPGQLRSGLRAGAVDVIGWPDDRVRLLDAPLRLPAVPRDDQRSAVVRLLGAAGGAGTSTLALTIGGLAAWSGRRALVVGDDDLLALCGRDPWSGPGAAELAALDPQQAGAEVDVLAVPVAGVAGLRVLGGGGAAVMTAAGWGADVVVCDLGRGGGPAAVDLVVARPDGCLRRLAAGAQTAVVVVGERPLGRAAVRRALGRAPFAQLPESARVARAGLAGRVPAGLPGTWVAAVRTMLSHAQRGAFGVAGVAG